MNKLNSKWSAAIAGVALSFSLFSANLAKAVTVTFSQGGWQYGGELSGSFTGDDFNGDGNIEEEELSDFNATFSGNLSLGINSPTGEPIVPFFSFSYLLPSLEPSNVEAFLNFSYSSSTSQLSFNSLRTTCEIVSPFGCVRAESSRAISVSGAGGFIFLDLFPRSGFSAFTTSSSSAPTVGCSASNLQ
jgi:hypothetical protein